MEVPGLERLNNSMEAQAMGKIVVRKAKHDYPGSNFRRVDLDMPGLGSVPLFGITRQIKWGITYWDHDSRALHWNNLADVKRHAQEELAYYYPGGK